MEATELGYLGNWRTLFLFCPSQMLTIPSHPPVANVPCLSRPEEILETGRNLVYNQKGLLWVEGDAVDGVDDFSFALLAAVALEGVLLALDLRGGIKVLHRHATLDGAQHIPCCQY